MDIYTEYIIKKKKTAVDYAIIAASILGGLLLTALGLIFNGVLFGMGLLLAAFVWYGVYLIVNNRNLEYEYILTNGELDIDKIIAKNGRKRIITINFREVELCAAVNNPEFSAEYNNSAGISKVYTLVGDIKADNVYFVDFHSDGERRRVLFQPSEKILDGLKKTNPRNVHA